MRHAPHLIRSKAVAEPAAVLLREVQIIIYNRKIGDKNVLSAILRHICAPRLCAPSRSSFVRQHRLGKMHVVIASAAPQRVGLAVVIEIGDAAARLALRAGDWENGRHQHGNL